jgi:hypothetical protein
MVTFVAFNAAASVVPLTTPVILIYVVNTVSKILRHQLENVFIKSRIFFKTRSPEAAEAIENAKKQYTRGRRT